MRQAVVRDQRGDVRQLGLLGAQEFLARRDVEEQIAHRDGGAAAARDLLAAQHFAARDFDARAGLLPPASAVSSSSRETEAMEGSASPRKPSVAMESRSFTSRSLLVAWRSKASSASSRSMPQPSSAMRISRRPPVSTSMRMLVEPGVERVFEQFLDDGGRPLHHLAGRDLVGDLVGENADAAHSELRARVLFRPAACPLRGRAGGRKPARRIV